MRLYRWFFVIGFIFSFCVNGKAQIELPTRIQALSNRTIAIAFEKEIRLYNEDLQQIDRFIIVSPEASNQLGAIEWSPDGQFVAINIPAQGKLQLWRYPQKTKVFELDSAFVTRIAWSPDSQSFATFKWHRTGGKFFIYSVNGTLQREWFSQDVLDGSDWYPSNNVLVTSGKIIKVLDATSFQEIGVLPVGTLDPGIKFNHSGDLFALVPTTSNRTNIQIWSYQRGSFKLSQTLVGSPTVTVIEEFKWHNNLIATHNLSFENPDSIQVWNAETGDLLSTLSATNVKDIAWTSTGDLITLTDIDVVIRDEITGEVLASRSTANQSLIPTSAP